LLRAQSRTCLLLGPSESGGGRTPSTTTGHGDLAGMADVRRQRIAQTSGILVIHVNFVRRAVQTEGNRLGGTRAVDVVDQNNVDFLSHDETSLDVE
jgi:hypothetical protein